MLTARSTYMLRASDERNIPVMYTATFFLGTGAEVKIVCSYIISDGSKNLLKRNKLLNSSHSDETTVNARRAKFTTPSPRRFQYPNLVEMFPIFAVNILLGTSFIDRFIRGIFPAEQTVQPWHSQLVEGFSRKWKGSDTLAVIKYKKEQSNNSRKPRKKEKKVCLGQPPKLCWNHAPKLRIEENNVRCALHCGMKATTCKRFNECCS